MKKKYALLSLVLLAVFVAKGAVAQRGGGGSMGGGGGSKSNGPKESTKDQKTADTSNAELDDLTSKLTLTDPQKAAVKSVLDGRDAQIAALRKEKLPKDEAKDKSKALKDAANVKIRALLTPDQQKIFDATTKKGGKKNKGEEPTETPAAAPASTPTATPAPSAPSLM